MKLSLILITFGIIALSCQSTPKPSLTEAERNTSSQAYQAQIKSDKRKQSELDLPIRSFPIDQQVSTVAFGSCADQDQPQPIWTSIEKNQPDLMIMLGDNIYASAKDQKPIAEQYNKLRKISEYRSIREKVPFMATWDDHDYGQNDAGANNPEKNEARIQFIKNWPYVKELITEKQDGIYHAKIFTYKKNKLQVIMLDTRSERDDLLKNEEQNLAEKAIAPKPYLPHQDKNKKLLSEKQWDWLESELQKPASLRIIASSIQLIANDHQFEKWGNFPNERERFFNLLKKHKIKNAVVLSGDRHMSAIAKYEIPKLNSLYDVTSSGLNKPARPGNNLTDSTYLGEAYGKVNFGLIKINWNEKTANIEIRSLEDEKVNSISLKF